MTQGGPRPIVDDAEWQDPTWRYLDCDSIDWGLELLTTDGRVFSVTWDPPGLREGLGIREQPLLGSAIRPDAASAVWDVSERSGWARHLGQEVGDVILHYASWWPEGFWCPWITLQFAHGKVEMLLGEGGSPGGKVGPSADNVAVLFDPLVLPDWIEGEPDSKT